MSRTGQPIGIQPDLSEPIQPIQQEPSRNFTRAAFTVRLAMNQTFLKASTTLAKSSVLLSNPSELKDIKDLIQINALRKELMEILPKLESDDHYHEVADSIDTILSPTERASLRDVVSRNFAGLLREATVNRVTGAITDLESILSDYKHVYNPEPSSQEMGNTSDSWLPSQEGGDWNLPPPLIQHPINGDAVEQESFSGDTPNPVSSSSSRILHGRASNALITLDESGLSENTFNLPDQEVIAETPSQIQPKLRGTCPACGGKHRLLQCDVSTLRHYCAANKLCLLCTSPSHKTFECHYRELSSSPVETGGRLMFSDPMEGTSSSAIRNSSAVESVERLEPGKHGLLSRHLEILIVESIELRNLLKQSVVKSSREGATIGTGHELNLPLEMLEDAQTALHNAFRQITVLISELHKRPLYRGVDRPSYSKADRLKRRLMSKEEYDSKLFEDKSYYAECISDTDEPDSEPSNLSSSQSDTPSNELGIDDFERPPQPTNEKCGARCNTRVSILSNPSEKMWIIETCGRQLPHTKDGCRKESRMWIGIPGEQMECCYKFGPGFDRRSIFNTFPRQRPNMYMHCVLCGPGHSILQCPLDSYRVRQLLRQFGFCHRCTQQGHLTENCTNSSKCSYCQGAHNSGGCPLKEYYRDLNNYPPTAPPPIIDAFFRRPFGGSD